jgi:hypothetical protein
MRELDRVYPGYGFARHKGYGTREHMKALLDLGPTPIHRRSFQPVEDAVRIRSGGAIDFDAEASRARNRRQEGGARNAEGGRGNGERGR